MFMLPDKVSLQMSSAHSVGDVRMRSWTGREFHRRGPAAAKVLVTIAAERYVLSRE